jgi:hypothetical protein
VAKGPCPSCGAENRIFFGGVLGVQVNDPVAFSESVIERWGVRAPITVFTRLCSFSGDFDVQCKL